MSRVDPRAHARTIAVAVTFFADLRRHLPRGADGPQRYTLPEHATVADLLDTIGIAPEYDLTVAVGGELADRQTPLTDGAEVMLLSPMEGGSTLAVEQHYGRGAILDAVLDALRATGKDLAQLAPGDLAPVDAFHFRGREATVELARRADLRPGLEVLDVGCGLGGSVRYLATEHGCRATGIDLTQEYVEAAEALARMVGLEGRVRFRQGSALALPFEAASFDVVWTEHAQMNIADKRTFYAEIARVLRPGGRLVFHDIFQGPGGPPHFPVAWADDPAISFLATPHDVRAALPHLGLHVLEWEDTSARAAAWFAAAVARLQRAGPPPLGVHLLMGPHARTKVETMHRNLEEQRIVVVQAAAQRA
jgi:SAM-dependent methyltransferase/sulfur carrier protein ThiS